MKKYHTASSRETKKLARKLTKTVLLIENRSSGARVIALYGDLGSGKTTFVQGCLRATGVRGRITSPTFVLMKRYRISSGRNHFDEIYHLDAYRMKSARELDALAFKKILKSPRALIFIEWASNIKKSLPRKTISLRFGYGEKHGERTISVKD